MKLFFLDDAVQRKCNRPGVGRLVAVGGIVVDAAAARQLDTSIDGLCQRYGFPERVPFKWSPGGDHWMRKNLVDQRRVQFFTEVLDLAAKSEALAQVMISDSTKNRATQHGDGHEMDVLVMSLERFNFVLKGQDSGLVIVARPSGDRKDEDKFLSECAEIINAGTNYASFGRLATNVLTMPFTNSRLLQVADLVVSITTAMVAGHTEFAAVVFPSVKAVLRSNFGRIGGAGVKIHPGYSYTNLYHWVLGDTENDGTTLPSQNYPYFKDGMIYRN